MTNYGCWPWLLVMGTRLVAADCVLRRRPVLRQVVTRFSRRDRNCAEKRPPAERNFPDVPPNVRMESRWFAGADDLDGSKLFNSHSTYDEATKRWKVDSFLAMLPRSQYQADPREVAWHYFTVNRLREQGMPIEERVKTMNSVAKLKPWLHGDERKQLEK